MIEWRDALSLAALVVAPLLLLFFAWASRERARALALFVEAELQPAVVLGADVRRRRRRAGALAAAAALLAVALAGPMWGFHWEEVRREGVDLVVAIDTSKSMLASDVQPNRLARAKLAVQDLLAELRGDRVGLVAFAGSAFLQCPLTLDRGAFRESLDAVEVGLIPRGGTNLQAALETGLGAFEGRQGRHQALVLITDGEGHEGDLEAATKQATERGIKLYTVGIGTSAGELIPLDGGYLKDRKGQVVKSRLDEDTLKRLALDTGGVYLHAAGADLGLTRLYRDHIATMEKRDLASTLERRWEHRFQIPLALAILLLLAEALSGTGRSWRRRTRVAALAALWLGTTGAGWLDPHATAREAARLYAEGKFDEAAARYREALVDDPDSSLLHLNLGAAAYRQGEFDDALAAFAAVPPSDARPAETARAAYNAGNAKYRLGAAVEASKPEAALGLYAEALAAYRRAMGADPADEDAKFNHEFVEKKIAELREKLEEQQQQQQQQQQQEQPPQDQPKDQQGQEEQQRNQERKEGEQQQEQAQDQPEKEPQERKDQGQQQGEPERRQDEAKEEAEDRPPEEAQQARPAEQPPPQHEPPPSAARAAGEAGGDEPDDRARQEAEALLDAQRDQEVRPDEMIRRLQGAQVAEPREDW